MGRVGVSIRRRPPCATAVCPAATN